MIELHSIDVHYAVQELQMLVGAKIEKAYQGERHDVLLHLYCNDGKKRNLRFLQGLICTPTDKPTYPTQPPGFAMFLRKRICGSRISSIEQVCSDRIIKFTCEYKGSPALYLIFELMAPGNILLVDENNIIINLLEQHQYKDRTVKSRQVYMSPPAPYPITTISTEDLARHIAASTKESIVKTLAMHCGMGGVYAEEACARANIAKHRNDLTEIEIKRISECVHDLLHQPLMPVQGDQRIYPFKLISKEIVQPSTIVSSTFLTALSTLVPAEIKSSDKSKNAKKYSPKDKLQKLVDAQTTQLLQLDAAAAQDQRKGELLYEHYMDVQKLLDIVHKARDKKQNIKEALASLTKVSYNDANYELTIEIPDKIGDNLTDKPKAYIKEDDSEVHNA